MENVNKAIIQGVVWNVSYQCVSGQNLLLFTVLTCYINKESDGTVEVEDTLHRVSYLFECDDEAPLLRKGSEVTVEGRIVEERFCDNGGNEKSTFFIRAEKIAIIPKTDSKTTGK